MSKIDIDKLIKNDFLTQSNDVSSEAQFNFFLRITDAVNNHINEKDGNSHITFFKKRKTISNGEFKNSRLRSYQDVEEQHLIGSRFAEFKRDHDLNKFSDPNNLSMAEQAKVYALSTKVEILLTEMKEEKARKLEEKKELKADTLTGYKVMKTENGKLISGADNRQTFDMKKYATIEMTGNGLYLSTNKEFVMSNYSGLADDEVLLTLQFNKNDIITGNINDAEPDLSVRSVKVMDIQHIEDGVALKNSFKKEPKKLLSITSLLVADIDKINSEGITPNHVYNHNGFFSAPRNQTYTYQGANQGILHEHQNKHNLSTSVFLNDGQLKEFGIDTAQLPHDMFIIKSAPFWLDQDESDRLKKIVYITKEEYDERKLAGDNVKQQHYQKDHVVFHYDLIPAELRTPALTEWYTSQPEYLFYVEKQKEIARVGVTQYEKDLVDKMQADFHDLATRIGVDVFIHKEAGAFYRPANDTIYTPSKQGYKTLTDFAEVNFHELGHSTAHNLRLNRDLSGEKGSAKYNKEEIIAQTISYLHLIKHGVDPTIITRSATYQKSYLDCLSGNNKSISSLNSYCKSAQEAFDYLTDLQTRDLTLDISHNSKFYKPKENIFEHKVEFRDVIQDIALITLTKQGVIEPSQSMLNDTIGSIIQINNIENPTELSIGHVLTMPTVEQVNEYKPTPFNLQHSDDILHKVIIVEPSISSDEVAEQYMQSLENENITISPQAKAVMRLEIIHELNELRGNSQNYKYIALNNPELKSNIFKIKEAAINGEFDVEIVNDNVAVKNKSKRKMA